MNKNTKLEKIVAKLVKVSFINGKLNPAKVSQIVDTLKNLSKGNAISSLSLYLRLLKNALDQQRLIIEAPIKLTNSQIEEIKKIVSRSTPVLETEIIVNPALLAGFKIKIGDEVYEDSVADKINQVKKAIHE